MSRLKWQGLMLATALLAGAPEIEAQSPEEQSSASPVPGAEDAGQSSAAESADAGASLDAAPSPDAGVDLGAVASPDSGAALDAAATTDGGVSLAPAAAEEEESAATEEVPEEVESVASGSVEEVLITGSRIRTRRIDTESQLLDVSREDMKETGLASVGEILQRLPNSGGALNTKFNSSGNAGYPPDGDGIGAGAAQADLRYLGSKRVLVLVDGVRWVNGSSASGVSAATDLNTIPLGMIERVEILQDGASAIYGSDAISGVINIITRRNFDGVEAQAQVGGYHKGDGLTQSYDVTWGTKKDRLSTVLDLSFARQDAVRSADRAISRYPVPYFDRCTDRCSSGTPQGRFSFTDPNTQQAVDVTVKGGAGPRPTYDPANPTGGDFHAFGDEDRFNFAPYNYALTPNQRFGTFGRVEYKVFDGLTLSTKVLFNNRTSKNQAAPEPLFIGPEAGNGNRLDRISIDATNPYNPLGFTLDSATNPYFIGRRPLEAGPRIFRQNVNTWYVSGGARGVASAGDREIYFDTTAAYARNRADQIKTGGFNAAKLEEALGPISGCRADLGCVPFNMFGGQGPDGAGTITKEMLDYVTFTQKDISEQELVDWTANVSSKVLDLPAGGLGIAIGSEYRHLSGFFQPDAIVSAGDGSDVPAKPTEGQYSALEGYGEINIPVLAELPLARLLDLSGAVRVSHYSTFGTEETLKAGGRYRPIQDLLLRGAWSQGFRAPSIGELFGSEARFDQGLTDPCSDLLGENGAPAPQNVRDNCVALGVPGDGSYKQFNPQISVNTGGNGRLRPETSTGYTLSAVYSPSVIEKSAYVDHLDVELAYYRIELRDAIRALDAQVQLDTCVRTLDPAACSGITRTPAGSINGFSNKLTNIGSITTDGFDFTVAYSSPATKVGSFRATSLSSLLLHFTEELPTSDGFQRLMRAGTEVGDPSQAYPRFKSSLMLGWGLGDWAVNVISRYIHGVTEPCRGLSQYGDLCSNPDAEDDNLSKNHMPARVYLDAQVAWLPEALHEDLTVTLGVNNLLNQDPPPCYSCALNGFDASTYDVPGVFGYIRAAYRVH